MIRRLLTSAAVLFAVASSYAQYTMPAQWQINANGYYVAESVDSIRFTDTNYDVYHSSELDVNPQGQWVLRIQAYGAHSVQRIRAAVIPAELDEAEMLEQLSRGEIALSEPLEGTNYTCELVVEDGVWKTVVFGMDADDTYRSHQVGPICSLPDDLLSNLNSILPSSDMELLNNGYHYAWGYGSLMRIRDIMTNDMLENNMLYSHYYRWATNAYMGSNYVYSQFLWRVFNNGVRSLDEVAEKLRRRDVTVLDALSRYALGTALATKALLMLDAARMYEFLPTDVTSGINAVGKDVTGLTCPLQLGHVDSQSEGITRATHEEMSAAIRDVLEEAMNYVATVQGSVASSKQYASRATIFGLMARLSLWDGDYVQAKSYAEMAISMSGATPLTRAEWLDPENGFNDQGVSSWLWAMSDRDNSSTAIVNWVSWMSNQTNFGYTGGYTGLFVMMDAALYDSMSDTDFRKLSYKAPAGSRLQGEEPVLDKALYDDMPPLTAMKFRPGKGNMDDCMVGAAVDVPLMRVEEMHFIVMEAELHLNGTEAARQSLTNFMSSYRDPQYAAPEGDFDTLLSEILRQKRIEFWGEGLTFFDVKRLNLSVTRGYPGSNWLQAQRFNTLGRPAWMNIVFVVNAFGSTTEELNNPDPSDLYQIQY